jgi:predicted Zn-dependent protease
MVHRRWLRSAAFVGALWTEPALAQDWANAGAAAWPEILKQTTPLLDPFLNREVGTVALRLMDAAQPPIAGDDWQAAVLDEEEPIAFLLPGGRLAVSVGLFDLLENQDQLAMIVAHEIAHLMLGHAEARARRALDAQPNGPNGEVAALARLAREPATTPFTPDEEAAADVYAVELLTRGGFDPREALALTQHFAEVENELTYAQVHARPSVRAAALAPMVPRLMLLYPNAQRR